MKSNTYKNLRDNARLSKGLEANLGSFRRKRNQGELGQKKGNAGK